METHRFSGMWRPDWQPLADQFTSARDAEKATRKEDDTRDIYVKIPTTIHPEGQMYCDLAKLRIDYSAGHFDVPVYEKKGSNV